MSERTVKEQTGGVPPVFETEDVESKSLFGNFLQFDYAARSVTGRRERNEDAFRIATGDRGDFLIAVVADGMGGLDDGAFAAGYCCDYVTKTLLKFFSKAENAERLKKNKREYIARILRGVLLDCSASLYEKNRARNVECGCTAVVCLATEQLLCEAHAGDSRLYVSSEGEKPLFVTEDHSPVAELVRKKILTEEESLTHPQRNLISSFIGTPRYRCKVDTSAHACGETRRALLCTDGICGCLKNSEIEKICGEECAAGILDNLLKAADDAGSGDNCTAVILVKDKEKK